MILKERYNSFTRNRIIKEKTVKTNNDLVPEIFHNYDVPISTWPVLLDKSQKKLKKIVNERSI
ncbi:hypothetical protein D6T69_06995 [Tenacibaculum singaporense]|uniref:Uncharacterized protein n=2 Tax=Tenacibaculum singaporense TaxID=2358479 RepID=A0A3Q8RN12_9FLAO|nr:hypothetical protein D6T69_06995 [Tenacibaculum singaporense]